MKNFNRPRIDAYQLVARRLEPENFKTLYVWLTDCLDFAGKPRGVPSELLARYGEMTHWEKAYTVMYLGAHLRTLIEADVAKLNDVARQWDESQKHFTTASAGPVRPICTHDWLSPHYLVLEGSASCFSPERVVGFRSRCCKCPYTFDTMVAGHEDADKDKLIPVNSQTGELV